MSMSNGQPISKRTFALYTPLCDIVQQRVEAMDTFGQMSTTGDGLMLLRAIKDVTYNFQSQKYLLHLLYESKDRFFMLFQGSKTTKTQAYLEQFQNMIDVIQHSGGSIGEYSGGSIGEYSGVEKMILGKKSKDNLSEAELIDLKEEIKDRSMAVTFLLCANHLQYGKLVENMENDYLQGRNNYPTTVSAAYHPLINWKQDPQLGLRTKVGPISHEVSFNTINGGDSMLPNNNGERGRQKGKANVTCNKCQKKVHYSNKCNEDKPPATSTPRAEPLIENQTATTLLMDGVSNGEFNSNLHFHFFKQKIETLNDEVIMQIGSDGQLPKS